MKPGYAQLRLFDWQDAVAVSDLSRDVKVFALTVGRHSRGMTGSEVKIQHAEKAELLGVSTDTITRRVSALVRAGYLVQTQRSAPGSPPRYVMAGPTAHDRTHRSVTPEPAERSLGTIERESAECLAPSADETRRTSDRDSADRAPTNTPQNRGVTLRTAERDRADQKQVSNSSSSVQPVSESIALARAAVVDAQSKAKLAGGRS